MKLNKDQIINCVENLELHCPPPQGLQGETKIKMSKGS